MNSLDPESEKVLNFFYQNIASPTGIGVNNIREHFQLSNERLSTVIKELEYRGFITDNPRAPKGTASIPAPNNFAPGQLYFITSRGIDYIKKEGEFKESAPSIVNQTIKKSPKAQIMANSPQSRQNIGSRNESIISKLINLIRRYIGL